MSVMCQICKTKPAQVHYTEIVNNNMVTLNLCPECAEEKGVDVDKGSPYGLGDLVAGLIDTTVGIETDKIGKVTCPACGYDYSDFKKIGRFGCPECYDAFEAQLVPMLRHIHGSTHHGGKKPVNPPSTVSVSQMRRRVTELKEQLEHAVEVEDYERAAQLRDEINGLESQAGGRVKDDD